MITYERIGLDNGHSRLPIDEYNRQQLIKWKLNLPDEYFFKECDEDEGVFIAQHIWTGEGSFGTGSFVKIVANVPSALQALRFKPGILVRLSGVDMGYVETMCRFGRTYRTLSCLLHCCKRQAKINDHRFPCVAARHDPLRIWRVFSPCDLRRNRRYRANV